MGDDEQAVRKQLEWQAVKLRDRLDKAMSGYPMPVCLMALADMFYGAVAATSEQPEQVAHGLVSIIHANRQPSGPILTPENIKSGATNALNWKQEGP